MEPPARKASSISGPQVYARLRISRGDDAESRAIHLEAAGADWLHIEDADGEIAGAPQCIESVHRILRAVRIPVQFYGGINLIHTAELVLGLGVERVVLGSSLWKTERSPAHFFAKLGARCVATVESEQEAAGLKKAGCLRLLYHGSVKDAAKLSQKVGLPVIAFDPALRNLDELANVAVEGALVDEQVLLAGTVRN